jgi:hypothetical protein
MQQAQPGEGRVDKSVQRLPESVQNLCDQTGNPVPLP